MSVPGPSPNGRGGFLGSLIDKLLGYADRPWRALFVLALVILGGVGAVVWQEREALLRIVSHPQSNQAVLRTDLSGVISSLLIETTADAIAIWSIDLAGDIGKLKMARRRGGGIWEVEPKVFAVVHSQVHRDLLVSLMRGEAACLSPGELPLIGPFLVGDGMNWVCIVPEPPESNALWIGMVMLAWKVQPSQAITDNTTAIVRGQTDNIVMH